MKYILFIFLFSFSMTELEAQKGYKIGSTATDFTLKNVDGNMVSLKDYSDEKGVILIFSCNHCPYVVANEDRIIDLHNTYASQGYPVVAISSNDSIAFPADSYDNMIIRAEQKGFSFAYLYDETQEIAKAYGATRTPHIFLLEKEGDAFKVAYIGAIDDNTKSPEDVTEKYVENAIEALKKGEKIDPNMTKAIGCSIKWYPN